MSSGRGLSVLHVNTADNLGGAARSAYKIHRGLRGLGQRSRMLVRTRATDDPDVAPLDGGRPARRFVERILRDYVDALGPQYVYYPSAARLKRHPWFVEADLVQLYNLHGGYFSVGVLPRLSAAKPLVWRLSDMWPFTGHCSYSHDCTRWKSGCGACPYLEEYPALALDTTALLYRFKARAYARAQLTVVVTNTWMEGLVRDSPLLGRFPLRRIANGVDTTVFRAADKGALRRSLGLPGQARVVLFAAHVARAGTRKGGEHVADALARVAGRGGAPHLVVMGEGSESWPERPEYPTTRIPFSADDGRLAAVTASADVLLHPAVAENFPNGVLEALACGVPVVAFDCGGVKDAVRHLETGYLARHRDTDDLARGVAQLLDDSALRLRLGLRGRELVEAEFGSERQSRAYLGLYRELLASRNGPAAEGG